MAGHKPPAAPPRLEADRVCGQTHTGQDGPITIIYPGHVCSRRDEGNCLQMDSLLVKFSFV